MKFLHAAKALSIALALAAPALVSSVGVGPAWAATATQSQATQIETALARYFDNVPGVVSVTPDGDHYKLRIDPGPLLTQLPSDVKVSLPALTYSLTDQGGGLWGLELAEQPLDVTIDVKGVTAQNISVAALSSTGTFDTALGLFRTATLDGKGIAYSATTFENGKQVSKIDYTIQSAQSQSHGAAGAEGAVDLTNKMQLTGLTQTMTLPAGAPPAAGAAGDARPEDVGVDDGAAARMPSVALRLMLMLARGFGKTEPNGDLTWQITSSAEGHLLINGQDMGPMK
jgi:hypothetical protein